jgi:SEC-C motif-containing protein
MSDKPCPCSSGQKYRACCAPFHTGAREAPTPEALMRSRYSGFAQGEGEYLVRTFAKAHPDLQTDRAALVLELSRRKNHQRYPGLTIHFTREDGGAGQVLFVARVWDKTTNLSFAELSDFVREDGGWRYASGVMVPWAKLPGDLSLLTRERFLALAAPA